MAKNPCADAHLALRDYCLENQIEVLFGHDTLTVVPHDADEHFRAYLNATCKKYDCDIRADNERLVITRKNDDQCYIYFNAQRKLIDNIDEEIRQDKAKVSSDSPLHTQERVPV